MNLKEDIRKIIKEEYPGERHWAGFTRWWLAAEGYDYRANPTQVKFVDGAHDGGVDAIAMPLEDLANDTIFVVQSKFYTHSPTSRDLSRFTDAVKAIHGTRSDFLEWLSTCREGLYPLYERIRQARHRCRFVVITPCRVDQRLRHRLSRSHIEVCDSGELRSLEKTYKAGQTPRLSELKLAYRMKPRLIAETAEARIYVFTVKVGQLAEAYWRHKNLLFSGNVRYALRGQTPKRVRDGIDKTLFECPDEFVFSHNGIAMVGRSVIQRNGRITIGFPSIVNGAQTVSHLGHPRVYHKAKNSRARVMVKLVEVKREGLLERVETDVAYRSNNQNKVDPSDLMVDLPDLVSLQRYMLRHKIHLERKKGEQKPHNCDSRVTKERLAQILAAGESFRGAAAAKRKQELFRSEAKRLFEDYNNDHDARLDAVCWVRIDDCLWDAIGQYSRKARRRRAQQAQFAALTVFGNLIRTLGIRSRLRRAVRAWESESEDAWWFFQRSFKEIIAQVLRVSGKNKKNEPAFYKAQKTLKLAIERATRRSKTKVRAYYNEAF